MAAVAGVKAGRDVPSLRFTDSHPGPVRGGLYSGWARIVPEPASSTAMDVLGDLHGVLGERTGAVLARKLATARREGCLRGTLEELRNPWAS